MAISKVVYDGNTLIDLTSDSVNASNLSKGTTAHNAAGEKIVGTFEQVQSDWNQNDETAVDYVKNRPSTMPNPNSLTFTGAVTGIYDGSEPLSVNIPSGETDDDMIDALYETGIINPVADNGGKVLLAADNNILTL